MSADVRIPAEDAALSNDKGDRSAVRMNDAEWAKAKINNAIAWWAEKIDEHSPPRTTVHRLRDFLAEVDGIRRAASGSTSAGQSNSVSPNDLITGLLALNDYDLSAVIARVGAERCLHCGGPARCHCQNDE